MSDTGIPEWKKPWDDGMTPEERQAVINSQDVTRQARGENTPRVPRPTRAVRRCLMCGMNPFNAGRTHCANCGRLLCLTERRTQTKWPTHDPEMDQPEGIPPIVWVVGLLVLIGWLVYAWAATV